MQKSHLFKELAEQLAEVLPTHITTLKQDFEKNCQRILNQAFTKLDLVTREEFDVQTKVLLRTRKKLEELEKQLHELTVLLNKNYHAHGSNHDNHNNHDNQAP